MTESTNQALHILQTVFGLHAFRGFQQEVIETVAAGQDALVLMPTGGGKSLCYQIPALMRSGVAVIVSPLIALMADQVSALRQIGVPAAFLNSTQTTKESFEVKRALIEGRVKLLYVAPERLVMPSMVDLLDKLEVALFAIDEAHCVSMWGHDFRPEYGALSFLREHWPQVPRVALTATADLNTRKEICEKLLMNHRMFVASFDRPNIRYTVVNKHRRSQALDKLVRFIKQEHFGQSGIVYCLKRDSVDEAARALNERGIAALSYHAGLEAEVRAQRQDRFLREDGIVMCATIAFGMGIDKPDVRFVAHLDMPKSIENYFQETGRAGRDGEPADAWMAYGISDILDQRYFIDASSGSDVYKMRQRAKLDAMLAFAETSSCRRQMLLRYFAEEAPDNCDNCDNCLYPPKVLDVTILAQKLVSCIWRCIKASGHSYGAGYIFAVLQGRETERIISRGHDKLSTFGIGRAVEEDHWRRVLRQLIVMGIVGVDAEHMNTLTIEPRAKDLLKGELKVFVVDDDHRASRKRAPVRKLADDDLSSDERALFSLLKGWRKEESQRQGVPAYVICPDATLRDIARQKPCGRQLLADVQGMGEKRLECYGKALTAIVRKFLKDNAQESPAFSP